MEVLEGEPVLVTDAGETQLSPGMCAGFPAGGSPHHLENRGTRDALILEVGDRGGDEEVLFPNHYVHAVMGPEGRSRLHADRWLTAAASAYVGDIRALAEAGVSACDFGLSGPSLDATS